MAGYGTGYPLDFYCAKAREIYYGSRSPRSRSSFDLASHVQDISDTTRGRAQHQVVRTGRTRPLLKSQEGKGHPRALQYRVEYACSCGHVGWSRHKGVERLEIAAEQ